MRSLYILALLVLAPAINSFANPHIGCEFGFNFPKGNLYEMRVVKTYFSTGGRAGINLDFQLDKSISFEPGVAYVTNGFRTNYSDYTLHTIQFPLDLVFKMGNETGKGFLIGFGPYVGYNINAQSDYNQRIKNMDGGFDINVGYMFSDRVLFKFRSQFGVTNLMNEASSDDYTYSPSAHNLCFGLSVGYTFGRSNAKSVVTKDSQPAPAN